MMLTPLGGALLKAAISRRDAEHNSPAFDAAGRRLGSFDYATCHLSCLLLSSTDGYRYLSGRRGGSSRAVSNVRNHQFMSFVSIILFDKLYPFVHNAIQNVVGSISQLPIKIRFLKKSTLIQVMDVKCLLIKSAVFISKLVTLCQSRN